MTHPTNPQAPETDRETVEIAFLQALERGESFPEWIRRYPQYARELTDLAIALKSAGDDDEVSEADVEVATMALQRAAQQVLATPPQPPSPGAIARAQLLGMEAGDAAREVQLSADVLYQIDRGLVNLSTLPHRLLRQFSAVLKLPLGILPDGLVRPQPSPALFYTLGKPGASSQISFVDALQDSDNLRDEDRDMWLAAAREEGLMP